MRALLQRVTRAQVSIDAQVHGQIDAGLLLLLGVTHQDTTADADFLADKCANLRIFCDEQGKMNKSVKDIGGDILVVSQFTLYGDAAHGRRPGFTLAALPEPAKALYEYFVKVLRDSGFKAPTGVFGADMQVELVNDGPVTLLVESKAK